MDGNAQDYGVENKHPASLNDDLLSICQIFCTNNSNSIRQLVRSKLLNFRTIIEFLFCSVLCSEFIIF